MSGTDILIQMIPFLVFWVVAVVLGYGIARRKGVRPLWIALGSFPLWTWVFVLYWASLTDKEVLHRLDRLEMQR